MLSKSEVEKYLPNEASRICKKYEILTLFNKRMLGYPTTKVEWWLRSDNCDLKSYVNKSGSVSGYGLSNAIYAVRPALYIHPIFLSDLKRTRDGCVMLGG